MKFIERENGILSIVKELSGFNIIIVGGYAVSARAKHRFSIDCDIVILKSDLEKITSVLTKGGFERLLIKEDFDSEYSGEFIRYAKKINGLSISVDILVNSLVCRTTKASWSFDYILKNSNKGIISGIERSVECLVPSKELLLAFKIHSARKTDLRDIIMLKDADWDVVKSHIKRGDLVILKKQIGMMIKELGNKDIIDSLKGVFQLKEDVEKMIKDVKGKLKDLIRSEIFE